MSRTEPARPALQTRVGLEQRLDGPKVLIVDDEAVVGEICIKALDNCRVSRAADGRQALKRLAGDDFDLVLTDVNMPDMSGLELLRTIKEKQPHQAVIIMTGYTNQETVLEALKADADDFISKPFNLLQLQTLVNKTLEKQRLKQELLQLKQLDRLKSEFLGMVSHKLNNPVTAISLFFQNLDTDSIDPANPDFQRILDLTRDETEGLARLIRSLLVYSELASDSAPLELTPCDLGRQLAAVIDDLQSLLASRRLSLSFDPPQPAVQAEIDQRRIRFAIRALLENAVAACADGDAIHIGVAENDGEAALTITDPGCGIPTGDQQKVFEKFFQVEGESASRFRGFGLGLYYARHFARMHGGDLTLDSTPGCGTAATLRLPL